MKNIYQSSSQIVRPARVLGTPQMPRLVEDPLNKEPKLRNGVHSMDDTTLLYHAVLGLY